MGRRYTISEPSFQAASAMDLITINGASGKVLEVIRWWWRPADNALATAQVLRTRCRLLPATVSAGSGGNSSPHIAANDGGDAAASFTARTRDTTQATSNGTVRYYDEAGAHIYNGYDQQPEEPITVKSGEAFVFDLIAVTGTFNIVCGAEVEEIG